MGNGISHGKRIDNNQTGLPDFVLRHIMLYVNENWISKSSLWPLKKLSSENYLELGLVCSYWYLNIIPSTFKTLTVSTNQSEIIKRFPTQLNRYQYIFKQYDSYNANNPNSNPNSNSAKNLVNITTEKLELMFDTIRKPEYTLWTLYYRSPQPNSKYNRFWIRNYQAPLVKSFNNLRTVKLYRIQTSTIRMEGVLSDIPTLTKLSVYPSHERTQDVSGLILLLACRPNIVRFTYLQRAAGNIVSLPVPPTLHKLKTTSVFAPTMVMEQLTKLHLQQNHRFYDDGSVKFNGKYLEFIPNIVDLTLINLYGPDSGPFLEALKHLRHLTIKGFSAYAHLYNNIAEQSHLLEAVEMYKDALYKELESVADRLLSLKLKDHDLDHELLWTALNRMDRLRRLSLDTSNGLNNYVLHLLPHLEMSIPTLRHLSFNAIFEPAWVTRLHDLIVNNDTITSMSVANVTTEQATQIAEIINKNIDSKRSLKRVKMDNIPQANLESKHVTYLPKKKIISRHYIDEITEKVKLTKDSVPPRSRNFAM